MYRFRWLSFMLVAAPFLFAGCAEEEEPETTVEAPPPPTPEEIKSQIMADTGLNAGIPAKGSKLRPGAGQNFLNQIKAIHAQHSQTPEGKEALAMVQSEIERRLPIMKERELWEQIVVLYEAHQVFAPGSTRFDRLKEQAEIELKKPKVTCTGLVVHDGITTATVRFFLPLTQETHTEQIRPGEVKHGMKFIDVIGNNRGIEMEYVETGERQQVMFGG